MALGIARKLPIKFPTTCLKSIKEYLELFISLPNEILKYINKPTHAGHVNEYLHSPQTDAAAVYRLAYTLHY